MLDKQVNALATIWRDVDLRTYAGDGVANLIKWVVFDDFGSGLATLDDIRKIMLHTPTILYWDKMLRYMKGVFRDGAAQIKLAEKFEKDSPEYLLYVKKQMHLINELSDDEKIDYFAQLTRCFLLTDLSSDLYIKLAKFLSMCTPAELNFLRDLAVDYELENTMMTSALAQYGLLMQKVRVDGKTVYALSDFGVSLKHNSLNFDDGLAGQRRLTSYQMMSPPELMQFATNEDIDMLFQNQEVLDKELSQRTDWGNF